MKEDIHLGRVVGETDAFVDAEISGHDVRNLLVMHAVKCADLLTKSDAEKIKATIELLLRGDLCSKNTIVRVNKNVYAIANERPPDEQD